MHRKFLLKSALFAITTIFAHTTWALNAANLYKQVGTDPSWQQIKSSGQLVLGRNSTKGVRGSKIIVNLKLLQRLEGTSCAKNPIVRDIAIHTVGNSHIPRPDFPRWSRWYQEYGNVQIFRLFKGETNVRNNRPLAARIEAYYVKPWKAGPWHEWTGEYTVIKPGGACIFQVFNNKRIWAVHLDMTDQGNIVIDPRNHKGRRIIARDMVGKPFCVRILDNGDAWRVYLNGKFIESGSFPCPANSKTTFRWGMYVGEHIVAHNMMYFVSGATVRTLRSVPGSH